MTHQFKFYIENDEIYAKAQVTVYFKRVDDSFDHEFGTKRQFYWKPNEVIIEDVINPETGEALGELSQTLEKMIKDVAMEKAEKLIF